MSRARVHRGIVACALAAMALSAACKRSSPPPPPRPAALVVTGVASSASVPLFIEEFGAAVASEKVQVEAQVAGRITAIHFADGADLKVGDALFSVEPETYEAELASAKARVTESQARVDQARSDFARVDELVDNGAISRQAFDDRRHAVEIAQAELATAQAAARAAEIDLERTTIRAPIEGRAGERQVDVGSVVRPQDARSLLSIQRVAPLYVEFAVPERELPRIRARLSEGALTVEVRAQDGDEPPVVGRLTFIDNAIRRDTGTVKLRATIANDDRRVWPGQFVRARLVLQTLDGAVLAPARAVQLSAKGPFAYVVTAEQTAEMRPVTVGQTHGDRVVIESGVAAGERVIVDGHVLVQPGGAVREAEPPASAEPRAP